MFVATQYFFDQVTTDLVGAVQGTINPFQASRLHLVKAPFVPSPNIQNAALVEADTEAYGGMQAISGHDFVWRTYRDQNGVLTLFDQSHYHFKFTAPPVIGNIIYGYYIDQGTPGTVLGSELFDAPAPLMLQTDYLLLRILVRTLGGNNVVKVLKFN